MVLSRSLRVGQDARLVIAQTLSIISIIVISAEQEFRDFGRSTIEKCTVFLILCAISDAKRTIFGRKLP